MIRTHKFMPSDRYVFDFELCTPNDGWAQVDTGQDASYYGTWTNPFDLRIISYVEGDVYENKAESVQEFVEEIKSIKDWNEEHGHGFKGIDAMCRDNIINRFKEIGLGGLLH